MLHKQQENNESAEIDDMDNENQERKKDLTKNTENLPRNNTPIHTEIQLDKNTTKHYDQEGQLQHRVIETLLHELKDI